MKVLSENVKSSSLKCERQNHQINMHEEPEQQNEETRKQENTNMRLDS